MNRDHFTGLFQHMEWADALMWKSVGRVSGPASDERLKYLLHHLHTVQWVYLHIWRNEPLRMPNAEGFKALADVKTWAREYYEQLPAFVDSLDEATLSRAIEFPWAKHIEERFGSVGPVRLDETLIQVAMHSTYHRAQVATRVRELANEPELTDYIAWLWAGRPAASW